METRSVAHRLLAGTACFSSFISVLDDRERIGTNRTPHLLNHSRVPCDAGKALYLASWQGSACFDLWLYSPDNLFVAVSSVLLFACGLRLADGALALYVAFLNLNRVVEQGLELAM